MIVSIPFSSDSKAVNYFICFVKYQNHVCWDKRTLYKVVKDTILNYIQDKLYYSQKNILFFEGFKRAVLQIDNNYQKRIQNNRNKSRINCFYQYYASKPSRLKPSRTLGVKERTSPNKRMPRFLFFIGILSVFSSQRISSISSILRVDS